MWVRFTVILVVLALSACTEPMEPVSSISKLRIMAIQADPPEIRPGESTTIRALWADPEGKGREVTFFWLTILGAFTPSSALPDTDELVVLGLGFGTAENGGDVFQIPPVDEDILDTLPEGESAIDATTVLSICADGELPDLEELGGMTGLSDFDLETLCKGGENVVSFKQFRISEADDKNRNNNPELTDVVFHGVTLEEVDENGNEEETTPPVIFSCKTTSRCLEGANIEATMTEESFETYDKIEFDEIVKGDEAPYVSWFVTGGELADNRSRTSKPPGPFKNKWSPPLDGGEFILWVVAHDLRGGTSWKSYHIGARTNLTH